MHQTFRFAATVTLLAAIPWGLLYAFEQGEQKNPAPTNEATGSPGQDEKAPPAEKRQQRSPSIVAQDLLLKGDQTTTEERIERKIDSPTDVHFIEMPLEDAFKYLGEFHDIPIWLDRQALNDEGISLDSPLTLKVDGARFESVLNLLLGPLELDWLIADEVLKITSRTRAAATTDTRTYQVESLLDAGHTPEELIGSITRCIEPGSWSAVGGAGDISHSGGVLICRQSQRVQQQIGMLLLDLETLAEEALEPAADGKQAVITLKVYHTGEIPAEEIAKALPETIDPTSWTEKGGRGSVASIKGAILVRQSAHGHREIEKLFRQLLPGLYPRSPLAVPHAAAAVDPFGTATKAAEAKAGGPGGGFFVPRGK